MALAQAQGEDDRPNVVVIQTDDQGLESMRVMKATNRLIGRRGATFRNNFTNWPICCPSRTTQLTGQYAHNHGVLGNAPPHGSYTAFPRGSNLAVWLDEAGYRVGHVGKFLNGYGPKGDRPQTPYDDRTEVPPGWTDWQTFAGGSLFSYYEYSQNEWSTGDQGRTGTLVDYGRGVEDFKTDVSTAGAVELVSKYARAEAPFYLQVDYTAPHAGGPRGDKMPRPPFDCADFAKSARRHADALDDMPFLPGRSPAFDEANVEDKPPRVAGLPRLSRKVEKDIKDESAVAWSRCSRSTRVSPRSLGDSGERASSPTRTSSTRRITATSRASIASSAAKGWFTSRQSESRS